MTSVEVEERLANLLAVTDIQLTRLDVDDLLDEVLERLCSILDADTAAVLLIQDGSSDLEARAAHGLEEEVWQGVRIPIGTGFAGTIAARQEPVILERVDETTVANPILWEKGVRRMVGAPLMYGGVLIGVIHVGRLDDESFTAHDAQLLHVAADRIAAAVHNRRLAVEAAAAAILERGLLPTRLPRLAGLQFATRYAPGEDRSVGGDWYDVFLVPSGQLWVVMGDVAGHGLNTAIIVARIKSALRAYALIDESPAHVLELTNRKLRHFEMDSMATVLCAVASAPYGRFAIASAGHLPPAIATDGESSFVEVIQGPPLGAFEDATYETAMFDLAVGSTLLAYTDGLVERRTESLDVGLARLLATMTSGHPEVVCRTVMHNLIGAEATIDDVAILAMHRIQDS